MVIVNSLPYLLFSSGVIKYMREIKFRAWDKEWEKMHKLTSVFFDYKANVKGIHFFQNSRGIGAAVVLSNYREGEFLSPLMQYTGLKDKNGKEIYEGDILKQFGCPILFQVSFYKCAFLAEGIGSSMRLWFNEPYGELEIIGNIYENPELLPTQPHQ